MGVTWLRSRCGCADTAGMGTQGKPPRYMRFWAEFEVEVTDVVQAAAFTMDWGRDADGQPAMMPYEDPIEQVEAAVGQAMTQGLREAGERAGFKWISGGPQARPRTEDGSYPELTLPWMPGRDDDGKLTHEIF